MSFIVHDYKCGDCGHVLRNHFVRRSCMYKVQCEKCGNDSMNILPCAPNLDWDSLAMGDNASPEAIRHWEKKHATQKAKEEKSLKEHGDYGVSPGA